MKKYRELIFIIIFFLITGGIGSAQSTTATRDSLTVKERQNSQTAVQDKSGASGNHQAVKQVRSARPDMSRTNGARPPLIIRQSGSGVPKGMGKPGGARGPGRR
jgi:hypothetical protein